MDSVTVPLLARAGVSRPERYVPGATCFANRLGAFRQLGRAADHVTSRGRAYDGRARADIRGDGEAGVGVDECLLMRQLYFHAQPGTLGIRRAAGRKHLQLRTNSERRMPPGIDKDLACFRQTQADLAKALIDVTHMRANGAHCVLGEATVCLAVAVSAADQRSCR